MVGTSGGMHQGHQSLVHRSVEDNDITAMYWGGAPADLSSWQPNSIVRLRARRRPRLAARRGSRVRHPVRARRPTSCSRAHRRRRSPSAVVLEGVRSARGPGAPRPDRAGDVQALEHVRSVPQLLRGEGLAATGDVRPSRRGPRVPGRGARLPDRPRRRRRRGVEPQLAAHARATRGSRPSSTRPSARAATPHSPAPPPRRRSSRCSPTRSTAPPPIQYFAVVDGPTMTPLEELSGSVRLLASIVLGDTRIVDNIGVELAES